MKQKIEEGKKSKEQRDLENATATYLQNTLARAKSRKMWKKYTEFYSKVFKSRWIFQMAIRTWRRKRGSAVIKKFLDDNKDRSPMNLMITKFMTKVRRVQRFTKSFLICHNLRIQLLGEIWDEVEDKFAKRLEIRMKDARKMKPITLPPSSDIDPTLVRAYNSTCDLWSIMDKKMDTLLQSERDKKHLSNNLMAAMHLEKLSRHDKRRALCDVLKVARAHHIQNISELENRILEVRRLLRERTGSEATSQEYDVSMLGRWKYAYPILTRRFARRRRRIGRKRPWSSSRQRKPSKPST